MSRGRSVSLASELGTLADAIDGVTILVDQLAHEGLATEAQSRRAPVALTALLVLVEQRLPLVEKTVRGDVDARLLLHAGNESVGEPGMRLRPRSNK